MYTTLDVVFHEDKMYFSSEFEIQGEYNHEVQTLNYIDPENLISVESDINGGNLDGSNDDNEAESGPIEVLLMKLDLNLSKKLDPSQKQPTNHLSKMFLKQF